MPDLVDVVIEDARWAQTGLTRLGAAACGATLAHLGFDPAAFELVLLGCDDARIAKLNGDFRDQQHATNVLSWPTVDLSPEQPGDLPPRPDAGRDGARAPLGDLAISYDTCLDEAARQNIPFHDHVSHLLAHGCLHLLGYDHIYDKDAAIMERLEVEILANLGIANPY